MWFQRINLLSILFLVALCIYFYMKWKTRRFNKIVGKLHQLSYTRYPLIGHAYLLFEGLTGIIRLCNEFKDMSKPLTFWVGSKLFICINKPEHLEIMMNSSISINKPEVYKKFGDLTGGGLVFTDNLKNVLRSMLLENIYYKIIKSRSNNHIADPRWRKDRKLLSGLFKRNNFHIQIDIIAKHSENFVDYLQEERLNKQFDISHCLEEHFFNVFFETSIGVNPDQYRREFLEKTRRALQITMNRIWNPFYQTDFIFYRTKSGKEIKQIRETALRIVEELFDRKIREFHREFTRRDKKMFIDHIIDLHLNDNAFTKDEVLTELIFFIFSGFETCATESSFLLLMLGMHQDIQEALYQEILEVAGTDVQFDYTSLSKLTYMDKVIKESMRLFPVAPILARVASDELDLGDYVLPAACPILCNTFGLHRCEKYFPNPMVFDPERFCPEEVAKRHRYSYIPFSDGPRNCIAKDLAMTSLKILFANVIKNFRIETAYKNIESIEVEVRLTITAVHGYPITIHPRI